MDSESNKLFVGGITNNTKIENLIEYFSKYGPVKNAQVILNRVTGLSRGFGFVSFSDRSSMQSALQIDEHEILGRKVAVNVPRPIQKKPQLDQVSLYDSNRNTCPPKTNKVFVGGLPSDLTKEEFDSYFETFGKIIDSVIIRNKETKNPRGFGFVTYDSEESVHKVLVDLHHNLKNKRVEVKRAIPKGYQEDSWGIYQPCLISCLSYQRLGPDYYGQPVWVYDPIFAVSYPSYYYYYSMPFGQPNHRVNGNGREDGPSSSSIARQGIDTARSVTIQELVETGVPEKPNDETSSCSLCAIDGYGNGKVTKSVTTHDEAEDVETDVSVKSNDETSEVIVHVDCESPKVVGNGISGKPMKELSKVMMNGNGVARDS